MYMIHEVMVPIGVGLLALGAILVLAPGFLERIERGINMPLAEDHVFSLRFGLRAEREVEERLNRPILQASFYWDGFVRRKPRLLGALFACAGLLIVVLGR